MMDIIFYLWETIVKWSYFVSRMSTFVIMVAKRVVYSKGGPSIQWRDFWVVFGQYGYGKKRAVKVTWSSLEMELHRGCLLCHACTWEIQQTKLWHKRSTFFCAPFCAFGRGFENFLKFKRTYVTKRQARICNTQVSGHGPWMTPTTHLHHFVQLLMLHGHYITCLNFHPLRVAVCMPQRSVVFVGLQAYQGKDYYVQIHYRVYSSLRDFGLVLKLEISCYRVLISWRILVYFRDFGLVLKLEISCYRVIISWRILV